MTFGFPMQCHQCNARYHLSVFEKPLTRHEKSFYGFLGDLLALLLTLPFLLFVFWLVDKTSWLAALLSGLLLFMLFGLITPHRINPNDPVNKLVLRIQKKKANHSAQHD